MGSSNITVIMLKDLLSLLLVSYVAARYSPFCRCGIKPEVNHHRVKRVIGGNDAPVNGYPWMASLTLKNTDEISCGGSVINSKWVATATHCFFEDDGELRDPNSFWVVLGEHTLDSTSETNLTTRFDVERIELYPDRTVDLALLKVQGEIDLDIFTPLCLPPPNFNVRGHNVTLTGWGYVKCIHKEGEEGCHEGSVMPQTLQEITFPTVENDICKPPHENIFCWGGLDGKGGCNGDSGSPVIYQDTESGQYSLVSTVSDGTTRRCGEEGDWGKSFEVSKYVEWIQDTASDGEWCQQ